MNKLFLWFLLGLFSTSSFALSGEIKRGDGVSQEQFDYIISESVVKLPKLWATIDEIKKQDVDLIIEPIKNGSMGKARGRNYLYIDPRAFTSQLKRYPEDRLVVVVLHEYGHLAFNRNSNNIADNRADHEYAAFKFSVQQASLLAEKGDLGPIQQLIHYLPLRVKRGNKSDPHTIALEKLTKEPFWIEQLNKYE